MLTVTLTNRAVLNNATGLDITVPTVRETEAPLGYSSIEYNIHVISKLPCFKTTKLKDTDVIEFVVSKTYREVQDLYEKLKRKYRNVPFPAFISGAQTGDENIQERQKTLEMLMAFISQSLELSTSSIFLQFLGVDPKNPQSIHVNIDSPLSDVKQSSDDECEDHNENEEPDGIFKKVKLKKEKPSETEQSQPLAEVQKPEKDLKDSSIKPSERFESLFDDTSKKPEPEDDDEYEDLFVAATKSKESSRIRNTFESGTPPKAKVSLFGEQDYGDKLSKEEAKLFTVPQCDPDEDFLFNSPRRNPAKKQVNDAVEVDLTDKNLDGILD